MLKPNTIIRVTKLINFEGRYAEYHHNGIIYVCRRQRGRWYVTAEYFYG